MTHHLIERCYHELAPQLFGFFYRALDQASRCEELVQQCFLILVEKRGTWDSLPAVKSFLFRTAHNLIREQRRVLGRMKEEAVDETMADGQKNENHEVRKAPLVIYPRLSLVDGAHLIIAGGVFILGAVSCPARFRARGIKPAEGCRQLGFRFARIVLGPGAFGQT